MSYLFNAGVDDKKVAEAMESPGLPRPFEDQAQNHSNDRNISKGEHSPP